MERPRTDPPPAHPPSRPAWLLLAGAFAGGALVMFLVLLLVWGPPGDTGPEAQPGATPTQEPGSQATQDPDVQATEPSPEPSPADVVVPEQLTWAPPELEDPETIELSGENRTPELDPDRDYILQMPDEPIDVVGGITVSGGRNVVLVGGEIRITEEGEGNRVRGLFLQGQTGTVHVEGLLLAGDELGEGINLNQREGAVVQLQNIRVETVRGEREGHHADVIQSWAGPSELRVDRLSGRTTYQGFFLLPMQFGDQDEPEEFDLRNIDLVGEDSAGYLLWRDDLDWPVNVHNVWVRPSDEDDDREDFLWARGDDNRDTWDDVRVGVPPGGPFVPEGVAGVDYESPGYLDDPDE